MNLAPPRSQPQPSAKPDHNYRASNSASVSSNQSLLGHQNQPSKLSPNPPSTKRLKKTNPKSTSSHNALNPAPTTTSSSTPITSSNLKQGSALRISPTPSSSTNSKKRPFDSISNSHLDDESTSIDHPQHYNHHPYSHHHHHQSYHSNTAPTTTFSTGSTIITHSTHHPDPSNQNVLPPSSLPPTEEDFPMIRCGWNDCRQGFWILEELIEHLVGENGHVPPDPNAPRGQKCPCEWTGCPKQGKPQGSRMALLVHLRSHTGEKPFSCHKPECDKTFSRTDALAKHVRVSHGEILPSLRSMTTTSSNNNNNNNSKSSSTQAHPVGCHKKAAMMIKTENESDQDEDSNEAINSNELSMLGSHSIMMNQQQHEDGEEDNEGGMMDQDHQKRSKMIEKNEADHNLELLESINERGKLFNDLIDSDLRTDEERKDLEQLRFRFPSFNINFLEFVLLKAKFRFARGERDILKSELSFLKLKEENLRNQKDEYLDQILKQQIGEESHSLWRKTIDSSIEEELVS